MRSIREDSASDALLRLYDDQQHTHVAVSDSTLPVSSKTIRLVSNKSEIIVPTHALLVHMRQRPSELPCDGSGPEYSLFPVHAIILAAHCSHLPSLSPLIRTDVNVEKNISGQTGCFSVPVVPLDLPDPLSWPALMGWLYTGDIYAMLKSICPFDGDIFTTPNTVQEIASRLLMTKSLTSNSDVLTRFTCRVHGLWANACRVGIWDESLWQTIEHTWSVIHATYEMLERTSSTARSECRS